MSSSFTQSGYIYVIANQDLTKIGITTDLKRRMKELKPDKIYATAWIVHYEDLEKKLHARYSRERIPQTEYFRLSKEQIDELILEIKNIEEVEQKKTVESVNSRRKSGKEETYKELLQSSPTIMTEQKIKTMGKNKAHPDYLSSLSWKQKLFGSHELHSENFDNWYKQRSHLYETEQLYKELYKENEDLTARVINVMARKNREAKRNARKHF